jgi:hypothetical protein
MAKNGRFYKYDSEMCDLPAWPADKAMYEVRFGALRRVSALLRRTSYIAIPLLHFKYGVVDLRVQFDVLHSELHRHWAHCLGK